MSDVVETFKPSLNIPDPISITEAALNHIREQIKKQGFGKGLRIRITTTGCSGKAYQPEIVEEADADDLIFKVADDINIFISHHDYSQYLKGIQIDYQRQGLNSKFLFVNPNEKASCGCGESFTV